MHDCNIHDNVATGGSADIYVTGGSMAIYVLAQIIDPNVAYCNFKSNPSAYIVFYDPVLRLERYVCPWLWQYGGGLLITGTATLTDTNVYANRADKVLKNSLSHCPAGTLRVLIVGRVAGGSSSTARQR